MKLYCLIKFLLLHYTYARLTLQELSTFDTYTFKTRNGEVAINPEGPLNLLRGYIYHKNRFMHNIRLFSPRVKTDYVLQVDPNSNTQREVYLLERSAVNDRAYQPSKCSSKKEKYLSQYYKRLILMFPSADQNLSIEAGRKDAFIHFLRASSVQQHVYHLLASLLLLSEGINVPIKYVKDGQNREEKIVLERASEKEVFFSLDIAIPLLDTQTNESRMVSQNETVEIIRFFIQAKNNIQTPNAIEGFKKGDFLESLQFLIQIYIFEFIDTVENAEKFVYAVHDILNDLFFEEVHPSTNNTEKKGTEVFDKYFMFPGPIGKENLYLCSIKKVHQLDTIKKFKVFPFADASTLPSYMRVPYYTRATGEFSKDKYFSNCVESSLYALFCCFLYDSEQKEYSVKKLKDAPLELKTFFETHRMPSESSSFEIHRDWCRVVSDLKNPEILYSQSKNELEPGLFNILRVIAEITGRAQEDSAILHKFEEELKETKISAEFYKEVEEYMTSTFKLLSINENITVVFEKPKKKTNKKQ